MLYTIKNDQLSISADTYGAELHSISSNGIEYLWQSGNSWKRYAPILFPFICSPTGKKYSANNIEYTMPSNHGFARDSEFQLFKQTENSISFVLKSNDDTLKIYPYSFEFIVKYTLEKNRVIVSNFVKNTDSKDIYFYVGGHPAFNCPIDKDLAFYDYYIEYEKNETIIQPLPDCKSRVIIDGENKYALSRELFDYDVIMKNNPESKSISLKSDKSKHSVTVEFPYSNCIAVWSPKSDNNAAFVCLEPWSTVPTYADDDEFAIENKKHAIKLAASESYDYMYTIMID